MKRFLAFKGSTYYPRGGWQDFYGSYDTVDGAIATIFDSWDAYERAEPGRFAWYHIVDSRTWEIVASTH